MRKFYTAVAFVFLSVPTLRAQHTITTVAGGVPNNTNALDVGIGGGLGISHVALDSSGNLYIADPDNNAIYKVSVTGELTTVAGIGTTGFSGDGGPATSAELNFPEAVFVDSAGDIFIADEANDRIREVVASTGMIQTVAGNGTLGSSGDGGPATSAELSFPSGIFVDSAGNIFIADLGNNRIREVVAPTGTIRTVAGNGNAGFNGDGGPATSAELGAPAGVFIDSAGNIFIADSFNSSIREVVASTGLIQTVAGIGNGTFGFSGDGGPATSAALSGPTDVFVDNAGDIFIADAGNNRIREVVASAGTIQTVAGSGPTGPSGGFSGDGGPATSAELFSPTGVLLDSAGDVFIVDFRNGRIREVAKGTGEIQTVAGNGTAFFTGDLVPADNAQLDQPLGVFVDDGGNIFIADTGNNRIREVVASIGKIQTVAGNGTSGPSGDGGPATSAELSGPGGVFVDSAGDIFIADADNNRIREVVASTGMIQTVAGNGTFGFSGDGGPATSAELFSPSGVFVNGSGDIFIADTRNNRIREVVASTGNIQTVAGNGVVSFSGDGGPATSAALNSPVDIFVDSEGDIFIADVGNSVIREVVASTGNIQTVAGGAPSAELVFPQGVFVDGAGDIFVADTVNSVVREVVASTGLIQTVAGNETPGFGGDGGPALSASVDFPASIWGDKVGNLFIADTGNSRIRMVAGLISVPAATLSPLSTFTGGQPTQTATLTNSGTAPLRLSSIAIAGTNPADFTFESPTTCPISGGTLEQGASCTLTITLASSVISAGAKSGTVSGNATLTVTHDAALGTPTPTATGSVSGQFQQLIPLAVNYAAPVLSFSPASLTFTAVNVPQTIALQNNGDTPLSITGITPPTGFVLGTAATNGCGSPTPSVNAPLTVPGNGSCGLNVTFTGSGGSSSGLLVFTDDGFSPTGNQSVAVAGQALIVTNGPSFTISNSAASPSVTVNLQVLGPSTVTYNLLCVVAPAGLNITCPTTSVAVDTTFNAAISIPSCAVVPVSPPRPEGWPLDVLVALVLGLLFLMCGPWTNLRRRVPAAIAVVCFAIVISSCGSGKTSSGGCVASITPQKFEATVTATPANNASLPTVTTVPPISITVTQ